MSSCRFSVHVVVARLGQNEGGFEYPGFISFGVRARCANSRWFMCIITGMCILMCILMCISMCVLMCVIMCTLMCVYWCAFDVFSTCFWCDSDVLGIFCWCASDVFWMWFWCFAVFGCVLMLCSCVVDVLSMCFWCCRRVLMCVCVFDVMLIFVCCVLMRFEMFKVFLEFWWYVFGVFMKWFFWCVFDVCLTCRDVVWSDLMFFDAVLMCIYCVLGRKVHGPGPKQPAPWS